MAISVQKKSLNDALAAITLVSDFHRFFIYYIDFPNCENVYNDMFTRANRKSEKQVNREIDRYHQKSLLNFLIILNIYFKLIYYLRLIYYITIR